MRVEDQRIKPSRLAVIGERVMLRKEGLTWNIVVDALAERRGDARAAAELYREEEWSGAARGEELARRKAAAATMPTLPRRPTKRDRRKLKAFFERG